jgi:hypothetical protein
MDIYKTGVVLVHEETDVFLKCFAKALKIETLSQ